MEKNEGIVKLLLPISVSKGVEKSEFLRERALESLWELQTKKLEQLSEITSELTEEQRPHFGYEDHHIKEHFLEAFYDIHRVFDEVETIKARKETNRTSDDATLIKKLYMFLLDMFQKLDDILSDYY